MAIQTFYLTDGEPDEGWEYLGQREIPQWADLGAGARPVTSYALFCPYCARVWGRMMVDTSVYCQCINSACVTHAQFPTDGTFSRQHSEPGGPRSDKDLPLGALKHDVLALCEYYINHPQQAKVFLHHA